MHHYLTTHALLHMAEQQWRYCRLIGWRFPRHETTTFLRYLFRLTHNGGYDRWWLRHVFEPRRIGPALWKGWMQS